MVWPPDTHKKKIRSNNMQLRMMVEYMSNHIQFARGCNKQQGPEEARKYLHQWEDLKQILKKYGPDKTIEQWRHIWRDLKRKARDEALTVHSSRSSTGKLSFTPKISDMTSKILSIIEKDYAVELLPIVESSEDCVDTSSDVGSAIAQSRVGSCSTRRKKLVHNGLDTKPQGGSGDEDRLQEEDYLEIQDNEVEVGELKRVNECVKAALDIKIAVIPEGFPIEQFLRDGWAAFVSIVFVKLEESSPLPGIDVEGIVAGAIHISCKNTDDFEWVCNNFNGTIVDGRKVKVVKVEDLPKPIKMEWRTRNYVILDSSRVLRLMQRAHPILRTAGWKVVETNVEVGLIRRIVLMDKISADYIKSYECRLNNGMCTDNFKVLEDLESLDAKMATNSRDYDDDRLNKLSKASQVPKLEIESPIIEVQEIWLTSEDFDERLDDDVDSESQYTKVNLTHSVSDEEDSVEPNCL